MLITANDLRVALVSSEYPPSSLGGVSAVCYDLSLNLSKRKIFTTVFCGKSHTVTVENVNSYLKVVRMPIINIPPRHLWFPVQNITKLHSWLKEYDIIHNVDTRVGGVLAFLKNKGAQSVITHVHGCNHCETKAFLSSPFFSWTLGEFVYSVAEYPLNEYLMNLSFRNSDRLILCSKARLYEMKRRNPEIDYSKMSVINNGIDLTSDRYNETSPEDDFSILFWGRLFYNKGIIQLIKALKIVRDQYPRVLLDICGKGPLEPKIRSLIRLYRLENNVRIHGYVTNEFLIQKIRKATIVTLPSLYEGQPVAALEAMAHKKTVIMYDYPFVREYLTDWSNGLIAERESVEDLADRICIAISDKKLRIKLGQNAYNHIQLNHNWDQLVDCYINLYKSVQSTSN